MNRRKLKRDIRIDIGKQRRVRTEQEYSLRSGDLSQVFESVNKFSLEKQVDFTKIIYEYVYIFLFFN